MHPLAVILAIATGSILGGIVGTLLAVPVAAVLNAVGHHLLSGDDDDPSDAEDDVVDGDAVAAGAPGAPLAD